MLGLGSGSPSKPSTEHVDFATLTQAVLDCIRSYDEENKVIREVQRIMSDEDDSD